jgi:hypothetical protein
VGAEPDDPLSLELENKLMGAILAVTGRVNAQPGAREQLVACVCTRNKGRGGPQVPVRPGAADCAADARACRRGSIWLGVEAADVSCARVSRVARETCTAS